MSDLLVSIIIPCRNEEKYIGKCLDSILRQDYPKERLEILVVDGMSEDRTRKIVERYKIQNTRYNIRILDNPRKFTPFAFNIGIKKAKGEIIILMGAHAGYEKDYVSKCVKHLIESEADNVGGMVKIIPKEDTLTAKAIALSLSCLFGAGDAYYKRGYSKEIKWVDTVFGGCYKREVFDRIGLFNEYLIRNQDLEFNLRLRKAGGKILLAPDIVAYYYPKSNFKDFLKHNFKDAFWVTHPLKLGLKTFRWRHLVPLAFVSGLIGTGILGIFLPAFFWLFLIIIGLYFLANIYFSAKIAVKQKDVRYLFLMPVTFACRHIPYGLGSIWGLIRSKIL